MKSVFLHADTYAGTQEAKIVHVYTCESWKSLHYFTNALRGFAITTSVNCFFAKAKNKNSPVSCLPTNPNF